MGAVTWRAPHLPPRARSHGLPAACLRPGAGGHELRLGPLHQEVCAPWLYLLQGPSSTPHCANRLCSHCVRLHAGRFARSGSFQGVVAADFSESMLKQARDYLQVRRTACCCSVRCESKCLCSALHTASSPPLRGAQEDRGKQDVPGACPVLLLRADVGRLPFATGSVAGIHAGAAIHCWPNPQVRAGVEDAPTVERPCTSRRAGPPFTDRRRLWPRSRACWRRAACLWRAPSCAWTWTRPCP